MAETDFAGLIEGVARELLGEPNKRLSKKNDLRFGQHGSLSVRTDKGTFYDNEAKEGGGVLALIAKETGASGALAIEWLQDHGFPVETHERPAKQVRRAPEPNGNGHDPRDEAPAPEARSGATQGEVEAVYPYTTADGKPVFEVVRFRLPEPEGKTFRQRDPKGRWKVKGLPVVPFNLPNVLAAIERGETVYCVEGEKDVLNMRDLLGLTATCNAGGSGKWTAEHSAFLAGADVVWLPDNDDAGRSHVAKAAPTMKAFARSQRVLDLPDLDEKEDVSDWLDKGGDLAEFRALLEDRARVWTPEPPATKFGAIMFEHLDDAHEDEHGFIIDDFFTIADVSVIAGPSKSGKSFLAIHAGMMVAYAAIAAAQGWPEKEFFGRKVVEGGLVVYQAGEGARGAKKRIRAWRKEFGVDPKTKLPFLLMRRRVDLFRDKDIAPFIAEVKAWQAYYDLPLKMIFIDTFATAIPGAEENSAKDMTTVMDNCARIRDECGCHVSLVHHMNAQGTKLRGSTAIFANLDNVLAVIRDEATKIRTVSLDKQKDEEDEKSFRFELKRVELGWDDKRHKAITSCVCLEIGERDAAAVEAARVGFKLADQERTFFEALRESLTTFGIEPPASLTLPAHVQSVVEWPHFRDFFAKKLWRDELDDEDQHYERAKKAMQRAGKALAKFGIIGRDVQGRGRSYVWWTGKPVRGFPKGSIPPAAVVPGATGALLDMLGDPLADDRPGDLGTAKEK